VRWSSADESSCGDVAESALKGVGDVEANRADASVGVGGGGRTIGDEGRNIGFVAGGGGLKDRRLINS